MQIAAADCRIRVLDNEAFLPALANHNHALRQISPHSIYCKMVFSDDWLFPRCLEEMVALAEAHPNVGIVGAYGLEGDGKFVKWAGLPYPSNCVNGRDVCRRVFLEGHVFGPAHSMLYCSNQVRSHDPFFDESNIHADAEACFDLLRNCDFRFVHQVLTYSGVQRRVSENNVKSTKYLYRRYSLSSSKVWSECSESRRVR